MSAARARCGVLAALIAMPVIASAQDAPMGLMAFEMTGKPPAAMASQSPMPIDKLPTFRMELGSNGRQFGMQFSIRPEGMPTELAMLADTRIQMVWQNRADSAQFAITVPAAIRSMAASMLAPELAATPPAGYRIAMKVPNMDSLIKANLDSAKRNDSMPDMVTRSIGTTSTVAGMRCENWEIISPNDSIDVCVVESSKGAFAMSSWLATQFKLDEAMKHPKAASFFGGRKMMPIRVMARDSSFTMVLVSASDAAPGAAFFAVPDDYKLLNPKDLPIPGMKAEP